MSGFFFNSGFFKSGFFNFHILNLPTFRCFLKNQVTEEDLYKYSGIFMVNGVTIGNIKGQNFVIFFAFKLSDCKS